MAFPPPQIRIKREVGTGDTAIDNIVAHMARLARRDAKTQYIPELAQKLKSTDELSTARSVFFFVADLFTYKSDPPNYEYLVAPVHSLLRGTGDCDCMTTALAALLLSLGFEVAFVVIAWDKKRCTAFGCPFTHVYLLVHISEYGWVPLDPVMAHQGFGREKAPIIRRKRYKVKLVTLEDNLAEQTGGCHKRRVPVQLHITNNIVAGNGNGTGNGNNNGNPQIRTHSPESVSTNEERRTGYYTDNSRQSEYTRPAEGQREQPRPPRGRPLAQPSSVPPPRTYEAPEQAPAPLQIPPADINKVIPPPTPQAKQIEKDLLPIERRPRKEFP